MNKLYKITLLLIIVIITSFSIFIIYDKTNTNSFRILSMGDKDLDTDYLIKYLKDKKKNVYTYDYLIDDISISELHNDIIYIKDNNLKKYLLSADMIILSIGDHELNNDHNIEEIKSDISNLINEIKRFNPNIYLIGLHSNNYQSFKVKDINNIFKETAKNNNVVFINSSNIDNYSKDRTNKEINRLIISALNLKNQ